MARLIPVSNRMGNPAASRKPPNSRPKMLTMASKDTAVDPTMWSLVVATWLNRWAMPPTCAAIRAT